MAEKRTAEIIFVDAAKQDDPGTVSEEQLISYYADNQESFRVPPLRTASVLLVTAADVADSIEVSEEELLKSYEERSHEFTPAEKREVRQVLVDDETAARQIFDAASAGTQFSDAVGNATGQAPDDIGKVTRAELTDEHAAAAFDIEVGAVAEPFETELGWLVVHAVSSEGGIAPPLDEIRNVLAEDIALREANLAVFDYGDLIDDALGGGATVIEAGEQVGLPVLEIGPISRSGLDASGDPVTDFPPYASVLQEIFDGEENVPGILVQLPGGGFFFVEVTEVIDDRIPAQSEIPGKVRNALIASFKQERAVAVAEDVAERLRQGDTAQSVGRRFGYEVLQPEPFTRRGSSAGLPSVLLDPLFEISEGDVFTVDVDTGVMVGRVTEIELAEQSEDSEEWSLVLSEFESGLLRDLQFQLAAALRSEIDVEIRQSTIDQVFFDQQ
jgi:peptidyl-prolyl cis-trans isomerase D